MSDLTVYAETLISTVARAFYEDEAVMLVDVLLRDKFLRDDDMSARLSLPSKQLRKTLEYLQNEHLVKFELVDDLADGGSQGTKFWYIDYNHAVNAIRLRIYLLRTRLEQAELQARSNSYFACPGFHARPPRCNGKYDEAEAQQIVDTETGLFLCQECVESYENDPNAPPKETYTLQLVDNKKALKDAVDNLRRVNVQLSSKTIGNNRLRESIFDLLKKVRGSKGPLSSNLPSENFSLGIGSKRIEGTGRTAGIKQKKRAKLGMTEEVKKSPVDDLTFLRNAIGQEVMFTVVKGSGARAMLLASNQQRRQKLMDAAASRVGADLPVPALVQKRKREKEEEEREKKKNKKDAISAPTTLEFLENNIGLSETERAAELEEERQRQILLENEEKEASVNDTSEGPDVIVVDDALQEMQSLPDNKRREQFQAVYKQEIQRQAKELDLDLSPPQLTSEGGVDADDNSVTWEDG